MQCVFVIFFFLQSGLFCLVLEKVVEENKALHGTVHKPSVGRDRCEMVNQKTHVLHRLVIAEVVIHRLLMERCVRVRGDLDVPKLGQMETEDGRKRLIHLHINGIPLGTLVVIGRGEIEGMERVPHCAHRRVNNVDRRQRTTHLIKDE